MLPSEAERLLTLVTGPPGIGKTHFVAGSRDPSSTVWVTLRDHRHAFDLAGHLVRHVRERTRAISPELIGAIGGSGGPSITTDSLDRAEQLGVLIGEELFHSLHRPLTLVVDELERLDAEPAPMRLIEALVRSAPPRLSIVLISRTDIGFSVARIRNDRRVDEVGVDPLGLSRTRLTDLVTTRHPDLDATTIDSVAEAAGGRPGAALLLGAVVAHALPAARASTLSQLAASDDLVPAATERLIARLDTQQRRVLDELALREDLSPAEIRELGTADGDGTLDRLALDHLVEEMPGAPSRLRCTRSTSDVLAGMTPSVRTDGAFRAAIARGDPGAALRAARRGDAASLFRAVSRVGPQVIAEGSAQLVIDAITELSDDDRAALVGLEGRAHQALGDWPTAVRCYTDAAAHAVTAADAWRHGLIHYLQGDPDAALVIYRRALAVIDAHPVDGSADGTADSPTDLAMLSGYAGAASWIVGDIDAARDHARRSLTWATDTGSDAALAVAHTAAALVAASDGDRVANDRHYAHALDHAERAGDALQVARIRSNQGSRLLEEGHFDDALRELDQSVRSAGAGGYGTVLAIALTNRGEVLIKLGRLDEARGDLATAVDLLQRQGSALVAYPLSQLARLYVTRGDIEQARAVCEEALQRSEGTSDRQIVVAVRLQYARAMAEHDPVVAASIAHDAAELAPASLDAAELWAMLGALHLRLGDLDSAAAASERAAEVARSRRDRYALALALEASALTGHGATRHDRLQEARQLHSDLGCVLDAARVDLHLAADDPSPDADARIDAVIDIAGRAGARPLVAAANELRGRRDAAPVAEVSVHILGIFSVTRRGEPILPTDWQSRKARTLFKMLATRRWVTRDVAVEHLWPDDDPPRAAKKLSVALATIRSVLDPEHLHDAGRYLYADDDSIRLQSDAVVIDLDQFVRLGNAALDRARRQPGPISTVMLARAEATYTGDVLEDEPYVDWYVPARESARSCYLSVARQLAAQRAAEGDVADALRLYLRILEREPYDEHAHLRLVTELSAAGRHGDARRHYQHYVERMRELDMEPHPFPHVPRT